MFENYNLVSMIHNDTLALGNIRERIGSLNSDIQNEYKDAFTSKKTNGDAGGDVTTPSKRPRGGQGGITGNGMRCDEHVYDDLQVVDAFTRAGYTLESYTLESDDEEKCRWTPVNRVKQPRILFVGLELMRYMQLKPTMRHATQSNGAAVVVKLLRSDSNKLRILEHLHSNDSPSNHTIPLLETFEMNPWAFMVFPEGTPLDQGIEYGKFRSEFLDFSQQLIEGVGFLHCHGIAHLDIKPQNIVILQNQLLIIDFDISVYVSGPDALIDRYCGTSRWLAPEIGREDGPRCRYSPIRADLWSCGQVLRYLAEEMKGTNKENPFEVQTSQLLHRNPLLRPLLYPVTVEHSSQQGKLKRKKDFLPHDVKRLAIGTVHT